MEIEGENTSTPATEFGITMLPQRLDTTLAHKAISLCAELSGTEKRVAAAIIDSFNRKTGQCDPGYGRIAHLLAIQPADRHSGS